MSYMVAFSDFADALQTSNGSVCSAVNGNDTIAKSRKRVLV